MGHKLLLACALCALLFGPARASAAVEPGEPYRIAAAIEALFAVGARYRYGGMSPESGFDCSGLVAHVFESAWGLSLPRRTDDQRRLGRPVKVAELEPGDLVFYDTRRRPFSHVGIYLGEGRFVHAPRTGQRVRVESIHSPYWRARFNGARRLEPPI